MSSLFELDIQNCKGVGPQRAKLFRKLGVPTVGDLLRLYPRAYEDWSQHCLIRDTTLNEVAVVKATVLRRPTEHRVKGGKLLYKTTVTDGDSDMALTFFNNKYIPTLLREGETYLFGGKSPAPSCGGRCWAPEFLPQAKELSIQPVYPATAGLSSRQIGAAVKNALAMLPEQLHDPPARPACGRSTTCAPCATPWRPSTSPRRQEEIATARFRLTFEEFLVLQLGLLRIKSGRKTHNFHPIPQEFPEGFCGLLPFQLTGAQRRAIGGSRGGHWQAPPP